MDEEAADRRSGDDAKAVLAASREAGVPVLVPAAVLAETLFGDRGDARANQALEKLQVVAITEPMERAAAELKRSAGMGGMAATIDAIVVAVSAAAGGGVLLTTEVDGIRRLSIGALGVRTRPVRV